MGNLAGKRALVTGASRGIGAAIARRLAHEGASVALTYEHSAERAEALARELTSPGRKAIALRVDAADPAAVQAGVDRAAEALGGLDILVNNAGIARGGPPESLTLADIDAILNVNVRGVIVASQAALKHLKHGGRIISIGSNLALAVPDPGISLYSASKAALVGWTRGLARDLGPRGITVNLVHPGSTDTDMNPAEGPNAAGQRARIPFGEYGKPEDIAAVVAFLAGDESRFVNGTGFLADGGAIA
ncbi:MAG: 3-oxoacyl-ACP reductase family protein [Polyangiales bacterium]